MNKAKMVIIGILVICSFILTYDAFVFTKKMKAGVQNPQKIPLRVSDLKKGDKFFAPVMKSKPKNVMTGCQWNITTSIISTPSAYPSDCWDADLKYKFAASCGSGTGGGCLPLYATYVYTTLDANCSETIWSSGTCSIIYDAASCGVNPNFTENICYIIHTFFGGYPLHHGVMRIYIFDIPGCGSLDEAIHVETAYTDVRNVNNKPTFTIIANPCP